MRRHGLALAPVLFVLLCALGAAAPARAGDGEAGELPRRAFVADRAGLLGPASREAAERLVQRGERAGGPPVRVAVLRSRGPEPLDALLQPSASRWRPTA